MFKLRILLPLTALCTSAFAVPVWGYCDDNASLMLSKEGNTSCSSLGNRAEDTVKDFFAISEFAPKKKQTDYWSEWILNSENEPLFSSSLDKNHFGFGVWTPEEYADKFDDLSYYEQLKAQGFLLSLGLGDQDGDEPRMRIDYRWHNKEEGDVYLQVEVPF